MKNFKRLSITKQYLVVLTCSFLIMLCLSVLIFFQAEHTVSQTSNEYSSMFSDTLSSEITSISAQAKAICRQLFYDINVASLLHAENWHEVNFKILDELKEEKLYIQEVNSFIADIAYVSDLINWSSLYTKADLTDMISKIAETTSSATSLGIRYGSFFSNKDIPYLVFGTPVYSDFQKEGYILVSLRLPKLYLPVTQQADTNSVFLIVDRRFNTYAFNCEQSLADEIILESNLMQTLFEPNTLDPRLANIMIKDYAISYRYIQSADCYIISAVNRDNITKRLNNINLLCVTIIVVVILLLVLVYYFLYWNYIVPLRNFNQIINKIEISHQDTINEPLDLQGCKEIRQIGDSFTSLLASIHDLNLQIIRNAKDLYELELQKKNAELDHLRNQINPHFISNTLELIRGIATDYSVPQISQICVSMGKILRYSITGAHTIPFQQEIDITLAYLNIQQARFHNRFTVFKNFQPDTLQVPIIKMLLQPLVENAIFHGLEPKEGNGTLFLNSTLKGDILKITIRDNGLGIPADKLSEIQHSLSCPSYDTCKNIGLVNINARLHLQYGHEYGITLESQENDGTCVTVILPAQKTYRE